MNTPTAQIAPRRLVALFLSLAVFTLLRADMGAQVDYCWNVCDGLVPCETECIDAWEDETTCGEQGSETCAYYYCGDGFCRTSAGEDNDTCSDDCDPGIDEPTCGNSTCDPGEGPRSCPSDCSSGTTCGDNICDNGETVNNCPNDCYYTDWCVSQQDCDNQHGSSAGYVCRGRRCVYAPVLQYCDVNIGTISCAGNSICVQLTPGGNEGVCIPRF